MQRFRTQDRQAISGLLDAQRAAWNRGDIEGFMRGYVESEELVFTSGGQIRRGFEETLRRYRERYGDDSSTMGQLSFEILDVQALGADGALVLGRYRLEGAVESSGVFSLGVLRTPDGWRILHDHTTADPS